MRTIDSRFDLKANFKNIVMKKDIYTAMILDDVLKSTVLLQQLLRRLDYIQVIHHVDDPEEALALWKSEPVDILFLDMEMPSMSGRDFAKLLDNPPVIIVVTGHNNYGYEANEIDSIGYLNKIPPWEILKRTVQNAVRRVDYRNTLMKNNSTSFKIRNFLTKQEQIILNDNFIYASIDDKDISIYLNDGSKVDYQASLSKLMEKLPESKFIRISAKQIVALNAIETYSRKEVIVRIRDKECINLKIMYGNAYRRIKDCFEDRDECEMG